MNKKAISIVQDVLRQNQQKQNRGFKMRNTVIISILITIIVTFSSAYIINSCASDEPFLKGSGKFIHGIREYQHSISGDDFKDFEREW